MACIVHGVAKSWIGLSNFHFHFLQRGYRDLISGLSSVKVKVNMLVTQACPLCDSMDCSPPGSSVHGIPQAGILEWVAISFSRGSSQPRDQTQVSCIAGRFFSI